MSTKLHSQLFCLKINLKELIKLSRSSSKGQASEGELLGPLSFKTILGNLR